jgi:hypothetical protein
MWVATEDLPRSTAHPFYTRLNQILDAHDFDGYVEGLCASTRTRAGAADGCCASAVSGWSGPLPISTRAVACAASISAG